MRLRWTALGIGAMFAFAGAATAASVDSSEQQLTPRDAPLARAFYHATITYRGRRTTQQNTLVDGELFRATVQRRRDEYTATTSRPVRLIAYCVGSHARFLPRGLRNSPGTCSTIRKRAVPLLEGPNRLRFLKKFLNGAWEAYEFGGPSRSIRLEGQVVNGEEGAVEAPIKVAKRGNQGRLVTVTCDRARVSRRSQESAQEGLVVTLRSGRQRAGPSATIGRRRTTHGGVALSSSIIGGPGVAQARVRESVNPVTCPGVDGSPATTIPGRGPLDTAATWFPTDRVFTTDPKSGIVERMSFAKARTGTLGRRFGDVTVLKKRKVANSRSSLLQIIRDDHRWAITFTPCPNPRSAKGCPAPKG